MVRDADTELDALRASLLSNRPRRFTPEEGLEAFQAHKLLAADVHRAAKLNSHNSDSTETAQWVRYITEHFPEGRNSEDDARLLWIDWRIALLKRGTLGPKVTVTHGQAKAHWFREPDGTLCLNLEDTWNDYAASVEHFIAETKRASADRRAAVLKKWRQNEWGVRTLLTRGGATAMSASAANGIATVHIPPHGGGMRRPDS
jgi:hypothetical protein